jgi:hypothetical protein
MLYGITAIIIRYMLWLDRDSELAKKILQTFIDIGQILVNDVYPLQ